MEDVAESSDTLAPEHTRNAPPCLSHEVDSYLVGILEVSTGLVNKNSPALPD